MANDITSSIQSLLVWLAFMLGYITHKLTNVSLLNVLEQQSSEPYIILIYMLIVWIVVLYVLLILIDLYRKQILSKFKSILKVVFAVPYCILLYAAMYTGLLGGLYFGFPSLIGLTIVAILLRRSKIYGTKLQAE